MIVTPLKRCPLVPARFRKAACYKRCTHWDRKLKECRFEVRRRVDEAVEGRHGDDEN